MLNELLKELVERAGGPTRVAAEMEKTGVRLGQTAVSNYTSGMRTPDNVTIDALLTVCGATDEERAAVWIAANVSPRDLAGGGA